MKPTLAAAALLLVASSLRAETTTPSFPKEPILRIEIGMHTREIHTIATDASGRYLVTGSDDGTVRLWDPRRGALLRVYRLPLAPLSTDPLYAVALSPDAGIVACGRVDGSVYLFDRGTGRVARWFRGSGPIFSIEFSPDGALLACARSGPPGVTLHRVADGALVAQDADLVCANALAYGAEALAATTYEGGLRLYGPRLAPLARRNLKDTKCRSVAFGPDGRTLAIGAEGGGVTLVSGADLQTARQLPLAGIRAFTLRAVAWDARTNTIFAGGYAPAQNGGQCILQWAGGGREAPRWVAAARYGLDDLVPLPSGSLAFAGLWPEWGVVDRVGRRTVYCEPAVAHHPRNGRQLLTNSDGSLVQFGWDGSSAHVGRFSLGSRRLISRARPRPLPVLASPIVTAPALGLAGLGGAHPALRGKPLDVNRLEAEGQAGAVAPDLSRIVVAGRWTDMRLFDSSGKRLALIPVRALDVNVSGDSRVFLAALVDGTIRWYRADNGQELLALFPHADRRRWVAWTPSGYYDCTVGAEEFIGWHINNGADQAADFYPASRFRSKYFRPDVVARVLTTLDEGEALRQANEALGVTPNPGAVAQMLPPVVTLLSPTEGQQISATSTTVRYTTRTPADSPVTSVKALVDGRPASTVRDLRIEAADTSEKAIAVMLPQRDCELSLIAENRHGASVPATVRLVWKGAADTADQVKPKLYILAAGISAYETPELRLRYAAKDAADFVAAFQAQKGTLYRDVEVRLLADRQASRASIADGLEWILRRTTVRDVAAIFLSGHGVNDERNRYYFVPADFDMKRAWETALPWTEVRRVIEGTPGKVLLFVDSCHSGNVMGERRGAAHDLTGVINELTSAENGAVVFAASTGQQVALEDPKWGNGAFTRAVVEGLSGKADLLGKKRITVAMLDAWVCERVKELTGDRQTPTTCKPQTVPDFAIAAMP